MKKPKIIPFKKKETKFSRKIKKTQKYNKKELALVSIAGKLGEIIDISRDRAKKAVSLNEHKLNLLLDRYLEKNPKYIKKDRNHMILLHTHIEHKNIFEKSRKYTALPSVADIRELIEMSFEYKYKYEIMPVLSQKGKEKGYTILKFDRPKDKKLSEKQMSALKKKITDGYIEDEIYKYKIGNNRILDSHKLGLFNIMDKLGINIYFSPMPGYRLDKNFNYVKK